MSDLAPPKVVTVADVVGSLPTMRDYADRAYAIIGHSAEIYLCENGAEWQCHESRIVTDQNGVTRVYLAPNRSDLPEGLR